MFDNAISADISTDNKTGRIIAHWYIEKYDWVDMRQDIK